MLDDWVGLFTVIDYRDAMVRMAALLLPLALVGGCCGYGGPGCGDPAIVGLCAGQVPLGDTSVTVSYGDDTGYHPAELEWVSSDSDKILSVQLGVSAGEVMVTGHRMGSAKLTVGGVEGWDASDEFRYSVAVVDEVDDSLCEFEDGLLPQDE